MKAKKYVAFLLLISMLTSLFNFQVLATQTGWQVKAEECLKNIIKSTKDKKYVYQFSLYDLDSDSIPEIIISDTGGFSYGSHYSIYKYIDNTYTNITAYDGIFSQWVEHGKHCLKFDTTKNEIITSQGGTGMVYHEIYKIDGNKCILKDCLEWQRGRDFDTMTDNPKEYFNGIEIDDYNARVEYYSSQYNLPFADLVQQEISKIDFNSLLNKQAYIDMKSVIFNKDSDKLIVEYDLNKKIPQGSVIGLSITNDDNKFYIRYPLEYKDVNHYKQQISLEDLKLEPNNKYNISIFLYDTKDYYEETDKKSVEFLSQDFGQENDVIIKYIFKI